MKKKNKYFCRQYANPIKKLKQVKWDFTFKEDNEGIKEEMLLNKITNIENKVLNYLKGLNINLTGNEIIINLKNKNIGNLELLLLSCIPFNNLEELNLSNNKISNIKSLKEFNFKNIKKIDLSNNSINANSMEFNDDMKLFFKENEQMEEFESLNKNIEIKLGNNNLIKKESEKTQNLIINKNDSLNDDSLNSNFLTQQKSNLNSLKNTQKYSTNLKFLINKLNRLEGKIIKFFNVKYNMNIKGNEIQLDLNNKNIGNLELDLLCSINFYNLETINLSYNNLSNIESLKNLKLLKNLDLSYNKIKNINSLKTSSEENKLIEKINLNNNLIENVDILKENIFPKMVEINLDNNKINEKDINEIQKLIINNRNSYLRYYYPTEMNKISNEKIKLFFRFPQRTIEFACVENEFIQDIIRKFLEREGLIEEDYIFICDNVKIDLNKKYLLKRCNNKKIELINITGLN